MYTFHTRVNNNTGTIVANIIISPPIVGVPSFCFCPSNPKSLTNSPFAFCVKVDDSFSVDHSYRQDIKIDNPALKEIYFSKFIPGM